MQNIPKAFAVRELPLKRFESSKGPLSATWTLYNPEDLLKEIAAVCPVGCAPTLEDLHKCLEKTGFNKAVRVRMEVLAWKERLRIEMQNICSVKAEYYKVLRKLMQREEQVRYELEQVRNILRIQREAEEINNADVPSVS